MGGGSLQSPTAPCERQSPEPPPQFLAPRIKGLLQVAKTMFLPEVRRRSIRFIWWVKAYPLPSPQREHVWPQAWVSAFPPWGESAHPSRHRKEGTSDCQGPPGHPTLRLALCKYSSVTASRQPCECRQAEKRSSEKSRDQGRGSGRGGAEVCTPRGQQPAPQPAPQCRS